MATQADYATVAAAIKEWALKTFGPFKEGMIDEELPAGAKIAVDALDAFRAKENPPST